MTTPFRSTPVASDDRRHLLRGLPIVENRMRLAGIRTAVLEGGEGAPVVLLHGPGEHAPKWLRVIPGLASDHRVVAPDLPGHGDSAAPGPLDVEAVLDWVDALIEHTCATPPTLVGQILGGAIAARYAAGRPGRIERLVLSDSLGLAPFRPAPEFGRALGAFMAEPTEESHDALWERCAFDLDRLTEQLGADWDRLKAYNLDRARDPRPKATQHGLMETFGMPPIPPEVLEEIEVPVTLIWGRHDLATPLAVAEAASERYGWPLVVIDGAADDPALERPGAFVDAVRGALADS